MALSMKKDSVLTGSSTSSQSVKGDGKSDWYENNDGERSDGADENRETSSFDMSLAGASTPLKTSSVDFVNTSGTFLSPMRKLDNLHLESNVGEEDYEDYEENYEAYDLGNKTIMNETDSDEEYSETDDRSIDALEAPRYINLKKRQHIDSPSDMVITPEASDGITRNKMSVCAGSTGSGKFKFSFSQSDSTPCPIQPRKKLKFKQILTDESTPSSNVKARKKRLLDFSSSVKTSAPSVITKLNSYREEMDENDIEDGDIATSSPNGANTTMFSSNPNVISTPISQSTPANSRAPSPPSTLEEYGDQINGYRFVKPANDTTYYNYTTPTNSVKVSSKMKTLYNTNQFDSDKLHNGKYKIVGEMPITSAGLMDESTSDIHVGDKRLLDPYASPTSFEKFNPKDDSGFQLRKHYEKGENLPLLKSFESSLDESEVLLLINDDQSVLTFYKTIQLPDEKLIDLLKSERIKWHPDKWYSKFANGDSAYSKDVIDSLSQVINLMIDNIS